jgi:aryl-alcohol dehydrogenase-like predicted oxidoreductase
MKYEKLGTTDISVSKICIGGMSFGKDEAHPEVWALDEHETEAMIGHAFDLGGQFH